MWVRNRISFDRNEHCGNLLHDKSFSFKFDFQQRLIAAVVHQWERVENVTQAFGRALAGSSYL
jgi:hypothetical protein